MDFITLAIFGVLVCSPMMLIAAYVAQDRGQSLLALIFAGVALGLGVLTPVLGIAEFVEGSLMPITVLLSIFFGAVATIMLVLVFPPKELTQEPTKRFSIPDIFAFLAGGLMLFSFFFLPWYARQAIDIDAVPQSLMARIYGGTIRQLDYDYVLNERLALADFDPLTLLFLGGTIAGLGVTILGTLSPKMRQKVGTYSLYGAIVVFVYYLLVMLGSNFHVPVIQKTGPGFWVGFFGMVLLVLQATIPRPAVLIEKAKYQRKIEVYDEQGIMTLKGEETLETISNFGRALRRLRRDRLTLVAGGFLAVLIVVNFAGPTINELVLGKNPTRTNAIAPLAPPGGCVTSRGVTECYVLGSDQIGRDFLSRTLEGGRISLAIAVASALLTATVGTVLGMAAGYFGGVFDDFMNWVITTLNSLPQLYLLIAIAAILRPDPTTLVIVFVVTGWTGIMRLIRGQTIATRGLDYVMAARALGASAWRIMFQHILPNLISYLSISIAAGIGGVILAEAALSFLNLGISAATPTWGNMLSKVNENLQGFFRDAPHIVVIPGVLISLTVLCLFIIGDGVRDAFDPTIND